MAEIHSTGGATSETSYDSALENLLNERGKLLQPRVICNGQLRNQGAGHPDFGLHSSNQCSQNTPKTGQGAIPERGVIEVESLGDNSWQTEQGNQPTRYLNQYGLVLVTNYREFRLIGKDDNSKPVEREYFRLADDEPAFWSGIANSKRARTLSLRPPMALWQGTLLLAIFREEAANHQWNRTVLNSLSWASYSR